jgi:hypothetical protein
MRRLLVLLLGMIPFAAIAQTESGPTGPVEETDVPRIPSVDGGEPFFTAEPRTLPRTLAEEKSFDENSPDRPINCESSEDPNVLSDCSDEAGLLQGLPSDLQLDDGYEPDAYRSFEGALSPYGDWVEDPDYGPIWRPAEEEVGEDFSPYETAGYFADTADGWTWVSDWSWGWAPFHYGRWLRFAGLGWCWIPGTLWGPSWVAWRFGGGYVGWAPLPPRGVVVGPPTARRAGWQFSLTTELGRRSLRRVPFGVVPSIIARTVPVVNVRVIDVGGARVRVNVGPARATVEAANGRSLPASRPLPSLVNVLSNRSIVGRLGLPLASRPWVQAQAAPGPLQHASVRTALPAGFRGRSAISSPYAARTSPSHLEGSVQRFPRLSMGAASVTPAPVRSGPVPAYQGSPPRTLSPPPPRLLGNRPNATWSGPAQLQPSRAFAPGRVWISPPATPSSQPRTAAPVFRPATPVYQLAPVTQTRPGLPTPASPTGKPHRIR